LLIFLNSWFMLKSKMFTIFIFLFLIVLPLQAYVGPGAGFAFVGSFLFIFVAFFLAFINLFTFPVRWLWRFLKNLRYRQRARFKRVIVVGYDGVDFNLLSKLLEQRKEDYPTFSNLAEKGTFAPLFSTEPPVSPVAWSTFATGTNPGKHNIFDFLTPDRHNYMPRLSLSEIIPPKKFLKIGPYRIPLKKPLFELKRKGKSFWKLVSSKGFFSAVLRVPYTFPPENFYGLMLSGLGTPDLRGAQGSFTFFSTEERRLDEVAEGYFSRLKKVSEKRMLGRIEGPEHPFLPGKKIYADFEIELINTQQVNLIIARKRYILKTGELSDWIQIQFGAGLTKISAIARFLLLTTDPLQIYLSPLNLDPEKPPLPISHPRIFSVFLAKILRPFATLGMVEDTWAVNEGILPPELFIKQTIDAQQEREEIFFNILSKIKRGLIVQVFEETDRIQHMFWRFAGQKEHRFQKEIEKSYQRMDKLTGKIIAKIGPRDLLIIVSDHGFGSFQRCFHLNSWLKKNGYIVLKTGAEKSGKWFEAVDWNRTQAYGLGLNGIFLNLKGREKYGIIEPSQAKEIALAIREKLLKEKDPLNGNQIFDAIFLKEEIYKGPYLHNAPDIILGYSRGYRVSWESAVHCIDQQIISDNQRFWSGDHAFTSRQVPGIFFCNRKVQGEKFNLADIAPTVLDAFGIQPPLNIDGKKIVGE